MQLIYYSFVKYGGSTGPSVNETSFINSLNISDIKSIKICRGSLPRENNSYSIREFNNKIFNYIYFCIVGLTKLVFCYRKNKRSFIVFRLSPLPISELLFCLFNNSGFSIKTLGDGLLTWKENTLLGRLNVKMLRVIASRSRSIDTVSYESKERIIKQLEVNEKKVIVIDNAVDTSMFIPLNKLMAMREIGIQEDTVVIGYTGNLPLERGGVDVINIVHDLIYLHKKNAIGLILGDDIGVTVLKDLAIQKNLNGKIVFPGRIPFNSIPTYVSALDLGVSILPSSKDGVSGQKVRQYASCGIRIISSQKKDIFIEDMGIGEIIPQKQNQKISEAAIRLLSKKVDRDKAHSYAAQHLSTKNQLNKRIRHWQIEI
jgi:glycosyltransferase involved in cell wall biosynthesis